MMAIFTALSSRARVIAGKYNNAIITSHYSLLSRAHCTLHPDLVGPLSPEERRDHVFVAKEGEQSQLENDDEKAAENNAIEEVIIRVMASRWIVIAVKWAL